YIACGKVVPERIAAIVTGIARACEAVGCPLVGGETAEHPGLMAPEDYDIAGAATGVVDAELVLGPQRVRAGDVLIAMAASGLHSNGYSLVRRVVEVAGADLGGHVQEFSRTLGEELLEPTRLYTGVCLDLLGSLGVGEDGLHALSHVTGGGLGANLARVLPVGLQALVERGSWRVPAVFDWVRRSGGITWEALEDSLNLGVGMVAVVGAEAADQALATVREAGIEAWVLGDVHGVDEGGTGSSSRGAGARSVSGTKGVHGGSVELHGHYVTE
ncbi:MAG: phosphoribosylformylglycinamidine cyclo-ligase, partial [Actinomyces sp.]|nr:phosphoribosylformylglycinamidine cyclo-ligase [Actinomyces sp.]